MQSRSDNITDAAGNVVPFAVVTINSAGGGLASLFADAAGTQPISNPLTCDVLGRFTLYAANGSYSGTVTGNGIAAASIAPFQLYDPADDTQHASAASVTALAGTVAENAAALAASGGAALVGFIQPGTGSVARSAQDKLRENVSTLDYGIATGLAADQTGLLNAAIADAATNGKTLELIGRIRVDGQIVLPSGARLRATSPGAIIDCTSSTASGSILTATGTLGSAIAVTGDVARFAQTIPATGHGLNVGDWFRIISTVNANDAAAGDDRLGDRADVVYLTETHQVAPGTDTNNIKIVGGCRFSYPTGSAVKKINGVTGIRLEGFKIEHASKAASPILLTLCEGALVEGVEVMNAGVEIAMRGCFGGSKIVRCKAWGDLATANSNSAAKIKILDGCVGVNVLDCDTANGGQLIDVTYTPSLTATLSAPCLDTTIKGGTCRNAYSSAIVDHPTCDGTTVQDVTMYDVKGGVFIRSRNGNVRNIRAWGGVFGDSSSIGVWVGENGYWSGLSVQDCEMHGFENGYYIGGKLDTLLHADVSFKNNKSHRCTIGERWVSTSTWQTDCGALSQGSRHIFPVATGIKIEDGSFIGLRIEDFTVRGPLTGSAVEIAGGVTDVTISGTVIDIGATIPALYVSGGATPSRLTVDIRRRGVCGRNSGVTRAMVRPTVRQLFSDSSASSTSGLTSTRTIRSSVGSVPAGAFDETLQFRCRVYGRRATAVGTAIFALRPPEANVFASITFPAGVTGDFIAEFVLYGTGPTTQLSHSSVVIGGGSPIVRAGVANGSFDFINGMATVPMQVTMSDATDAFRVEQVITEASWA